MRAARAAARKVIDEVQATEPKSDLLAEMAQRQARLAAIEYARERLGLRQREASLKPGRGSDNDRRPLGADSKPKGRRHKREFGARADKALVKLTDQDSRIMTRAVGGLDATDNGQMAADKAAQDTNWLLPMRLAVPDNLGELPELGLADARYSNGAESAAHGVDGSFEHQRRPDSHRLRYDYRLAYSHPTQSGWMCEAAWPPPQQRWRPGPPAQPTHCSAGR